MRTKQKLVSKNPYLPKPYKVLDFYRETPDTFTLTIDMAIKHDPGQFVQVSIPGVGEAPISICSDSEKFLKLNIREIGNVTRALAELRSGDTILIRGPYGHGYPMKEIAGNHLLFIGGGCGIAPLKGIIDYFARELEEWQKQYHMTVTVDQNPHGKFCYDASVEFVTAALERDHVTNENKVVFVCGPPVMMDKVIKILKNKGFNDDQIFISAERLMYCAIGICCHCMIRGKYTCLDGPVFRYDEVKDYTND
ncbi:FAD/NAD(P)-binding protein [Candidatus Woesearchaeota archaeon]|nr:FAD/NAD(P)-binding protein [Candidatus Woesearchaeota archaeon]